MNRIFIFILAVIAGSALSFAVSAKDAPEKSDIVKGVEGKIREGKTGTSNENAEYLFCSDFRVKISPSEI